MKKATIAILVLILWTTAATTLNPAAPQNQSLVKTALLAGSPTPVDISLSATESDTPVLGVDGNGAAYVVWFEYEGSRSFYFATNKSGAWSSPQYIEQIVYNASEAGFPWMDVSASGVCHLIYQDGRTWVSYDIFHTAYQNNSWSPLTNVSDNNGGSCYSGCAVNPVDNYTYVVWQDGTGLEWGWNLLLRYRSPSGSWGSIQLLPIGGGYMPQVAIDAKGTAHLIWTTGWGRTLWYSRNSTPQNSSQWTQPTLIKWDVGEDWSYAKVACDNAGNAYVIWMDGTAQNDEIFLRKVNSDGSLAPEINVSQSAASSQEGAIAANKKNGDILIAWKETNDIYVNAFVGGVWSGPGNVTKGLIPSKMPSVAVDGAGGAHLAFAGNVNGNWEIIYMALLSGILVTSPNGGEVWDPGTSHNVTWMSTGISGNVKIEYSKDNGANYTTVIASTPNTGSYNWTIPNTPSNQCLVRVSEAATGSPSDVSDGTFTISGPIPCTYSISPTSQLFSALGGIGSIDVATQVGCGWTATSNDSWIIINSGNSGSASGKVIYAVLNNANASPRSGTITAAAKTFTVNQEGKLDGTTFFIPFGALNNGNVNIGNLGSATANIMLRILDANGLSKKDQSATIPAKGVKRTWDLIGNIFAYGKPVTVEVTSDQTLIGDNIKWSDPPYDTVGAGFTCGPLSLVKGKEFYFPFSAFGQSSGYAVVSNTTTSQANLTVEVYDQAGVLKKTSAMTVGAKGVARTWETIGSIQAIADPAVLRITSDQDVVVEAVRWEQNKRGWGFAILPSATGSGTSFLVPFGSLNNGSLNLANISASTANVTLRVLSAAGQNVKEQAFTIPAKGVKRSWDLVGNIFGYGKPVTVEVTSDQPLVGDNIKWSDPPYDTVGAGFTCGPLSLMKGKEFYFPFSAFGQSNGYAVLSNTAASQANVTIEVYDQAGVLKKTSAMTIGAKGVARTWETIGSIQAIADPAVLRITSDQDVVVEAVRWEQNKRGWGFAILPITQ
jgi:hypothetical protein